MNEISCKKEKQIHIRVTDDEKRIIEHNASKEGFHQVSEYLRHIALQDKFLGEIIKLKEDPSLFKKEWKQYMGKSVRVLSHSSVYNSSYVVQVLNTIPPVFLDIHDQCFEV